MKYLFTIILLLATISAQSLKDLYKRGYINFENDLTISDEHQKDIFHFFSPLHVDNNENILVKDKTTCSFLKFDKNGKLLNKIGKKGKGPGELSDYANFQLDDVDNLVSYDYGNARFSFFDNTGKYINSERYAAGYIQNYRIMADRNLLLETTAYDEDGKKGGDLKKIEIFTPKMKRGKTIDSKRINDFQVVNKTKNSGIFIQSGYENDYFWDLLSNDNIVTACSGDNIIKIFTPEGNLVKSINGRSERKVITEKDKENFFTELNNDQMKKMPGMFEKIKKELTFPEKTPFFQSLLVDDEGNFLLLTYANEEKKLVWHAYTKEGEFINIVKMPSEVFATSNKCTIKKGKFYMIANTDDGVQIKRYKIK